MSPTYGAPATVSDCTAHKADTGKPCRAPAILGGRVCVYHGGKAPQVRAAALLRIAEAVPSTLERLLQLVSQDDDRSVSMRAVADLLDRAGFKPTDKLKLSGDIDEPLEIVISRRDVLPAQSAADVPGTGES